MIVFLLARRLIVRYRARGAAKRYALYSTTLSYRKIRDLRIPEPASASNEDYARAFGDLNKHLGYIRSRDSDIYNKSLKHRPIRALTKEVAAALTKKTGPNGGYERYIW